MKELSREDIKHYLNGANILIERIGISMMYQHSHITQLVGKKQKENRQRAYQQFLHMHYYQQALNIVRDELAQLFERTRS